MRYVLLQHARGGVLGFAAWTAQAPVFAELSRELRDTGELVWMEALAGKALPSQRSAGATGNLATPGVLLLASWVIECDTAERALEIAGRIARGKAPNGASTDDFSVEVRPVLRCSGEEM